MDLSSKCDTKKKLCFVVGITAVLFLATHGYRMFNNMYAGDALINIYQADYAWQIALGRCFNPVWVFIRGTIVSPWFLSLLAIVWSSLSVFLVSDIFETEGYVPITLISAVLCINSVITSIEVGFLPWIDLFTFSFFLNVLGAWLLTKKKPITYVCGILCIALGLGTYQAYIMISIAIIMILLLRELISEKKLGTVFKQLGVYVSALLIAGGLYYCAWKFIQKIFGIWTSNSYNGLSSLGDYGESSLISLIGGAYERFFYFFLHPDTFVSLYYSGNSLSVIWKTVLVAANIILICVSVVYLLYKSIKNKTGIVKIVLLCAGFLLFPLGCNIVFVISKGMEHTLMIYSFLFVYVFAIILAYDKVSGYKWLKRLVCLLIVVLCWSNLVFSNQIYTRKGLEEDAALSLMTKVVIDIESMDGYIPGETPVAFVGAFQDSPCIEIPEGLRDLSIYGMRDTAVFYEGTAAAFIRYNLNVNMKITETDRTLAEVNDMPIYPAAGSMEYVGDVLVVKISD